MTTIMQQWEVAVPARVVVLGVKEILLVVGDSAAHDAVRRAAARVLGAVPHIAMVRGDEAAEADALIRSLRPHMVIGVGTAVGLGPLEHHRPGDIVVATALRPVGSRFEPLETGPSRLMPPSVRLLDRCTLATVGWRRGRVHFGPILSMDPAAESVVDTPAQCAAALDAHPGAMAAENEGTAVFAAAQRAGIDWLVVKAVGGTSDPAAEFAMHVVKASSLV
ncbi:hypothetical protein [Allorhizocola rhizosphaerae]|uniref:5'-methylthioadenosine/S-adenosylhomocysteine nucleosidase family protein n=1 Tax=Allorhizocola rhizosphaerae TaxID=1872709 RepID=UPI0013C3211A|nr:hypothetical protein [Allorhizocola rhizosphaerae]